MKLFKVWISVSQNPRLVSSNLVSLLIVLLLIAAPIKVKAAEGSSRQKSFLQQVEEVFNSLKTYINQLGEEFSQGWGELSGEIKGAIESSIGDLDIPNPIEAGKKIKIVIGNQKAKDILTTSPEVESESAESEWHQVFTQGHTEAILSEEGQKVQRQEAEMSNEALSMSSDLGDAAQSDIVTQDILKKVAIQNAQQAIISKSMQGELQQQTRALAIGNMNLADISKQMSGQERMQQHQRNVTALQVLKSAAFVDAFWQETETQP